MQHRLLKKLAIFACFLLLAAGLLFGLAKAGAYQTPVTKAASPIQHFLYVFPDQSLDVYDMDHGFQLVKQISLPQTNGGRGIIADPTHGFLYLSYGGDGGVHGLVGSILKYDLIHNLVVWTKSYPFGIDSGAISPDGKTIYMPDGEAAYDGTWHLINTSDGSVAGSIYTTAGNAAHNTIVGFTGKHVYLGGLNNSTFFTASTATKKVTSSIGAMAGGVRPFTINGRESLVFTTHTGLLGFQVSSLKTHKILYTVTVKGFTAPTGVTSSHGITLSPDEKELYLIDTPNSAVHVFDISGLPTKAPTQVATIALSPALSGTESPCLYDCTKEGWLLHVADGRYVVVGDSGDVIDTTIRTVAYYLPTVNNTRKFLEIDWQNYLPIFTTTRQGMGYVGVPAGTTLPTPLNASTVSPTATASASPPSSQTPSPSPTLGTVMAQDTFTRANQQGWGTAADGQSWGGDATSNAAFSIHNNVGQIANGSGPYNAVLGPTVTDAQVFFTGSLSSFANNNLGAVLRWQDSTDWYKAYINGTQLVVQKQAKGTYTILAQVNFTAAVNTPYDLRFQMVGSTLTAKVWASSTTEPAAWQITTTDSTFTSGQCGLRIQVLSATSANITSFEAINLKNGG